MYLPRRFYIIILALVAILAAGYWWNWLFIAGQVLLALFALVVIVDIIMLWCPPNPLKGERTDTPLQGGLGGRWQNLIIASRQCSDRFSCGDDNEVAIHVDSTYPFDVDIHVIDEVPHIFQRRDIDFQHHLAKNGSCRITYNLRPTKRGVYGFGRIRVFASTILALVQRRFTCDHPVDVKVYPSYLMLNRYELLAMSNNLTELGIKRIRRAGNNTEFEQIKEYVQGDEYRAINWKASARRNQLMVNVYTDERSQQIFNLIDKGRVMQQAFKGMTLLDYAINASLVLSYVAVRKEDKAGLMTFNEDLDEFLQAAKSSTQMQNILEALYAQETDFGETDYSALLVNVNRLIRKRSLLVLYTNFSGLNSLYRQLPYLRQLNQRHRLLVVFFADEELSDFIEQKPLDSEEYYQQIIAEKISREKQLIVTTLQQQGILSLLTTPDRLSINVINRYLEIKSRQMI
ncbi:MAG: DUF58 domain-containing protein [Muribaculaceae bacterium]|nr:DUF58 domain-containing protein [Muribaculaceae bacterium]